MSAKIQSPAGAPYGRIMGIGSYRPVRVVDNEEMCTMIDSTDEWIVQRTGISERRWANDARLFHVVEARSGNEREGMTVPTRLRNSHLTTGPSSAMPEDALDSGPRGPGTKARPVVPDRVARQGDSLADPGESTSDHRRRAAERHRKSVRPLHEFLSPRAGAAVSADDEQRIGRRWGADGAAADVLKMTHMWDSYDGGDKPTLYMEGQAVFKWASQTVARKTTEMLDKAGLSVDDLDLFIPHQANIRITDAMIRTLRMPEHVTVARDIKRQGNTSAASIPLGHRDSL